MININTETAESRGTRLNSIINFEGNLESLVCKGNPCSGMCSRGLNQNNICTNSNSLTILTGITNVVVVDHAPLGCASSTVYFNSANNKWGKKVRGLPPTNLKVFSTNMKETDSVFGATEKLRTTIIAAYNRHKPDAIIVTASCVSGIIGEDISMVTGEVAEELGIPIIPVFCEGLKSKIWADGFDAGYHALLKYLVKPPQKKNNRVNFINFQGSARAKISEMFAVLGLEPMFIADFTSVADLAEMSESVATVSSCGTLGTYLGTALQEQYGIPYVNDVFPHGIKNYETWYKKIAAIVGKEAEAEEYLKIEREKYLPEIEELKKALRGTRAVIGMGPGFAYNYVSVLQELGVTIQYVIAFHYDSFYDGNTMTEAAHLLDETTAEIPASICDLQNFEILRILHQLQPDVFINRHNGVGGDCIKMGIPLVFAGDEYAAFGYTGTIDFGNRILDAVTNKNFVKNLAKHTKIPYQLEWLNFEKEGEK